MALTITNNVASLNAQNSLDRTNGMLSKSLERLSTGLKVNRGADGPAALVISEQQRAQIAGIRTAIDNTNKAVSLVQTGEGALNEMNRLLVKVRGLALDSANSGVNDAAAQAANQAEIKNALSSMDRIATTTQFGTKKLLDGTAGKNATSASVGMSGLVATKDTAVGAYTISVDQAATKGQVNIAGGANGATALRNAANLGGDEVLTFAGGAGSGTVQLKSGMTNTQVVDAINAKTNETGVVASLETTNGNLVLTAKNFGTNFTVQSSVAAATAGATGVGTTVVNTNVAPAGVVAKQGQNLQVDITGPSGALNNVVANGNVLTVNSGAYKGLSFTAVADPADSAITDFIATDTANITVADGTLTFQIGANAGQTATLALDKVSTDALGQNQANNQFANLRDIDVSTTKGAQDSLAVIDKAVSQISSLRGDLGAFQANTLESTATNLRATLENTVAAESIIRDTDFAAEIANFTKYQTQLQAGSTVLGNANQLTQLVAGLLR
jgi:flagellin